MADVELSSRAVDWLEDSPPNVEQRVIDRLKQAAEFPEHFLYRLSGSPYYKLRIGDYRAIVEWRRDDDVLFVRTIGHRRNVYDR